MQILKVTYQIIPFFLFIGISFGKKASQLQVKSTFKPEVCSEVAEDGDQVSVHYTGKLETGAVFDSSVQAQREPLSFILGERKVIPGWEMGIKGMCVGEKRKLTVPPHLAYGKTGYPPAIPEEATLLFDTELMGLVKKPWKIDFKAVLQFAAVPALVLYVAFYLYQRYQKEASQNKGGSKRGSKKRK